MDRSAPATRAYLARPVAITLLILAAFVGVAFDAQARTARLFTASYGSGGLGSWQAVQQPPGGGRIGVVAAPGVAGDPLRPSGPVMQTTLKPGDRTNTGGYVASRAEVYGRHATPRSTAPRLWPDPVGSKRWYAISVFVPADFQTTSDTKWLVFTQWKGLNGGSPPVSMEIKRDGFRLGGARTNSGLVPKDGFLGPIVKGQWTRFVVGMKLSPSARSGWLEVHRDGVRKIARMPLATMDRQGKSVDPIYIKQGIYRTHAWTVPHTLYFGPVKIGTTRAAVS